MTMMYRVQRQYSESVLNLNVARITFYNIIMEIDRQLLYPAFYYAHTSDTPVSLTGTAWLCVKMYTSVEHDLCPTCYERPPVLSDRFWWAEGVVAQDRFYCISKYTENFIKSRPSSRLKSVAVSKLQVAILARSSREMSQTVRID